MTTRPKAVIVKGNPHYINGNPKADAFYEALANLLREQGYDPSFDAGEPHTLPDEKAALWVAHSRGKSRLQYAPPGVKTLGVDQFEDRAEERRAENEKLMQAAGYKSWAEWPVAERPEPPDEHYQVTDALRSAIKALAVKTPANVLAHVAGPSGSGKTTLAKLLAAQRPDLRVKDLDELDYEAERQLGLDSTRKSEYDDAMLKRLYDRRQELLDAFIAEDGGDVVLTGHHLEGKRELNFPAQKKYLLDVDAKTSARRGYERSQTEDPKYRRLESDLPSDEKAAQEDIDFLTGKGYSPASAMNILKEFSKQASTSGFDDQRMHELLKTIVVDQLKGSTKDFGADYPIPTMTYPTDYGSIPGHVGEDGDDLDFFKGTGTTHGRFRVRRPDVKGGVETKFWAGLTPEEKEAVVTAFRPVIDGDPEEFSDQASLDAAMSAFVKKKLIRYTHGGEGTWRKTKAIMDKLPPELVEKINAARAKFHRPDLDPTSEYESYFTEGGAKKYEDELLPLHRQALGDDIKREEIAADDAPAAYEDADQRIFTKAASTYVPLGVPKPAPKAPIKSPMAHHRYLADDDEHEKYVPVGIDGLLAATEKLLAVNRGLAEPDDRDSLPNDRIYTVDRLMAERIKLDHGRTLRAMMGRLSRIRNLAPVSPDAFGEYTVGYIRSNPLVPALEEINPMHILEQKRRITKMGPGGVGDPNAITEAMQAVSATQFGFVDPIAGPESEKAGIDVRLAHGTRIGSDGRIYQLLLDRKSGKKRWVSPSDMRGKTLKLPD